MEDENANYLKVIMAHMDNIREDVQELKNDLKHNVVGYNEWNLRNDYLTQRIDSIQGDLYALRKQIELARAPWYTYVTVFVAVGALMWSVFGPTI